VQVRLPIAVGAFLFLFYLLTFPGAISPKVSDGRSMYLVTQSLVDRHSIAIIPPLPNLIAIAPGWRPLPLPPGTCATEPAVLGIAQSKAGPAYSKFGIGQSLAAVPLYVAGLQIARAAPAIDRDEVAGFVTSSYTALVTALTAALLCALALRLGWSGGLALGLSVLFGISTPAWAYTTSFFSEPTLALCLLGAVAAVIWEPRAPSAVALLLAGSCLGFAVLTHAADSIFYVPLFGLFALARVQREDWAVALAALSAPLIVALAVTLLYNAARFGSPLTFGYGIAGDIHDLHPPHTLQALWEGIYGPLLSPGKGLFLYAPILLLFPWALVRLGRRDTAMAALVAGIVVVTVLTHANTLIVWLGGWAWGPRFMIPVLPIMVLTLGSLLQDAGVALRRLAWALGALGAIIQVPAVLLDKDDYIGYLVQQQKCVWSAEDLYKWHPQYSPLIGQWQRLLDLGSYAMQNLATISPHNLSIPAKIADGIVVPRPHPWWMLLAEQGAPYLVLALTVVALVVVAALMLQLAIGIARSIPGERVERTS